MIHKGVSEVTLLLYSMNLCVYVMIVYQAVTCTVHYCRFLDIIVYKMCTKRDMFAHTLEGGPEIWLEVWKM